MLVDFSLANQQLQKNAELVFSTVYCPAISSNNALSAAQTAKCWERPGCDLSKLCIACSCFPCFGKSDLALLAPPECFAGT
eukprot:199618-Amphidinium_carterae.1